jgi:hypothetical protein
MEQPTIMDNNNPSRQAIPFSPLLIPLQQPCPENINTSYPLNNRKYLSTLFPWKPSKEKENCHFTAAKWLTVLTHP